jgi:hypothetical protein
LYLVWLRILPQQEYHRVSDILKQQKGDKGHRDHDDHSLQQPPKNECNHVYSYTAKKPS